MSGNVQEQVGVGGFEIGEPERRYIEEVLKTSRLSYGPMTRAFETQFAGLHGCRHAVFCNSGTSALHMALAVLKEKHGWEDGDEVIVPATTFVATPNVILHNHLTPVFVDVERDIYNLDPALIEERITSRTRAILVVHLYGQPASMDGVLDVAQRHGLQVVEDSCETMFASYKERSVGSMGDIGCFSTYVAHILVTGVGGFATTSDPELAVMLRSCMNHGRDGIYLSIDDDKGKGGEELQEIVSRRFKFIRLGHSFRCTELEAAIGLGQLEQAEGFLARRKEIAERYTQAFSPFEDRLQLPRAREDRTHSYMMYPLVLRDEPKWDLVNYLEERGIETREMMPLINQPLYAELFKVSPEEYPVTRWINESGFYIGSHPFLRDDQLNYVIEKMGDYFRS